MLPLLHNGHGQEGRPALLTLDLRHALLPVGLGLLLAELCVGVFGQRRLQVTVQVSLTAEVRRVYFDVLLG